MPFMDLLLLKSALEYYIVKIYMTSLRSLPLIANFFSALRLVESNHDWCHDWKISRILFRSVLRYLRQQSQHLHGEGGSGTDRRPGKVHQGFVVTLLSQCRNYGYPIKINDNVKSRICVFTFWRLLGYWNDWKQISSCSFC